jgi:hypothetical protein
MGTNDELTPDLAKAYDADPLLDEIDLDAGWNSLRPLLPTPGVTDLHARRRKTRRVLVAASMAAAIVLAASIAIMLRVEAGVSTDGTPAPSPAVPSGSTATAYARAVADLESTWRDGRARLLPQTVAAIEQSLAALNRAIQEAEAAVASDPTDDHATQWLETVRSRKLRALRQALEDLDVVLLRIS